MRWCCGREVALRAVCVSTLSPLSPLYWSVPVMSRPDWYLDEMAHAGPEHLDSAPVETYDRKAQTDPTEEVALLRGLGLNEAGVLVDLGAGTGTFALAVAPHCARVVAVDPSAAMRAALATKASAPGVDNVELVSAGLLSYEHQGPPVDFIYSRHVLHHLPDFWKGIALARIAAILRPGGIFSLRDLILRLRARRSRRQDRDLAVPRRRAPGGWLDAGRVGDPSARRIRHVQLAVGSADRARGLRRSRP